MSQPPLRRHDLWSHQCRAYDFAYPREASLIGAGCGSGKTCVAMALADNWDVHRTLVLCPSTVRSVWRREIYRHRARYVKGVVLGSGSVDRRTTLANHDWWRWGGPLMLVINYEAAWREPFRSWALRKKWDLVILDESHRCQRETNIARFCRQLHDVSCRRLCLTGTPLTQDPVSVWGQCRFLDPSVFGDDLEKFLERYHNEHAIATSRYLARATRNWHAMGQEGDWTMPDWVTCGLYNREEFWEKLGRLCIRIESDVLDLPPLTVEKRTFAMSSSARRLYDAIEDGHADEIATGRWADLKTSYATTMRLQQITSGWLPDKDGKPVTVDTGKADCLRDILQDAGEPVVVYTRFVNDLDTTQRVAESLGLAYGEISGRRKDGMTDTAVMPEHLDVVGVQRQAGGTGIDLSRARIAVEYSPTWSVVDTDQAVARVYRPPQDRPVLVYQLMAENSIDQDVEDAIQARRAMVRSVWENLSSIPERPTSSLSDDTGYCEASSPPIRA